MFSGRLLAAEGSFSEEQSHCVSWTAKKSLFFFIRSEPVGVSCDITTTIERSAQNLYKLVVSVPHRSFNSGEPTRDKDVESLLGGEKHPNIQLETEELSKEAWQNKLLRNHFQVTAYLWVKGQKNLVSARVSWRTSQGKRTLVGSINTSFSKLKITAPSAVGGVFFNVSDPLLLSFRFEPEKIKGSEQVLSGLSGKTLQEVHPFYSLACQNLEKQPVDFQQFADQLVLVVNIASKCGYTSQLGGLQKLYQKYKDRGFVILGVPSNDFYQEPLEGSDIKNFCQRNFGVNFPVLEKMSLNGGLRHPLYTFLISSVSELGIKKISWNFEKFLVSRKGVVLKHFKSRVSTEDLDKYLDRYFLEEKKSQ